MGVKFTSEPYDDAPNLLNQLVNGYIPDPQSGSAVYSRPGFEALVDSVTNPQGAYLHIGTTGTAYNFLFANGAVYRVAANGGTTAVTPTGVAIDSTALVYAVSLGDNLIVSDGVNPPWIGTNLGATPITGTRITYSGSTTNVLKIGTTQTAIGWDPVTVFINGTQYDLTNNDVGEPLPAGSIPAAQWGVYNVTYDSDGPSTYVVTAGAANYTTGYATEAAAIAALPAVGADSASLGYFTVQAAGGAAFLANTSALAGGTGGVPAQRTNYYAAFTNWTAYGPPVIYSGCVFFVLNTIENGASARSSITWSEPNFPDVGYQQTDYDNTWTLTQTGSDPIYALAPTNDALYYSRQLSWGALAGTPNVNFQNTASHDVVSGNVGCVAPRSVRVFLNYIYFVDAQGRPYRFANGGTPEPLWMQARQFFDESFEELTAENVEALAVGVIEPNLNLYLVTVPSNADGGTSVLVFDSITGTYSGYWVGGGDVSGSWAIVGMFGTDPSATGGGGRNVVFGTESLLGRITLRSEDVWTDTATDPLTGTIPVLAIGPWMGFSLREKVQLTQLRALVAGTTLGNADGDTSGILLDASTTQTIEAGGLAPPLAVVSGGIPRYVRPTNTQLFGRGGRVVLAFWTQAEQVLVYRMEMEGVPSLVTIRDR